MKMYSATIPVMSSPRCLGGRCVADLSVAGQAGLREDLVVPVDRELALRERRLQEVEEVARVHLAGVVGQLRGKIHRAHDLHSLMHGDLPGTRQLAVAALL